MLRNEGLQVKEFPYSTPSGEQKPGEQNIIGLFLVSFVTLVDVVVFIHILPPHLHRIRLLSLHRTGQADRAWCISVRRS